MQQPNILLITCDQMVAQLTGAYGHPVVETPNLNRLAAEGVRFDNAYTSCAICVPARGALKTGMYGSRTGCYDNGALIPADQPTFSHYLSIAGYDTVAAGKMHFIGPDQLHGFEKRLTTDFHPADFNFLPPRPKGGFKDRAGYHAHPIAIDYVTAGVRQWSQEADFDEEVHFRALEYRAPNGASTPARCRRSSSTRRAYAFSCRSRTVIHTSPSTYHKGSGICTREKRFTCPRSQAICRTMSTRWIRC